MKFRNPIAKKPWAKDVKDEESDRSLNLTKDSFDAEVEETYDYYSDDGEDYSGVPPMSSRMSTLEAFRQDSMFLDYQISSRKLGASKKPTKKPTKKKNYRVSTGVVTALPPMKEHAIKPRKVGAVSPLGTSCETLEEGDEDEDSSQNEAVPVKPAVRRGMVRNNSWTSNRNIEVIKDPVPRKKKQPERQKNANANSVGPRKKKRATGEKKKTGEGNRSKSPSEKSPSNDPSKKPGPANPKSRKGRPVMERRNSWSSSRKIVESEPVRVDFKFLKPGVPRGSAPTEDDDERSKGTKSTGSTKKKKGTDGSVTGRKKKTISEPLTSKKKKVLRSKQNGKERKSVKPRKSADILASLRKTVAIRATIMELTKTPDFQRSDIVKLQQELSDALDEVVLLNEEHDEQRESITKSSLEVAELKMMLAESAKENHELEERLRENISSTSESQNAVEEMTKEVEVLREEKQALANILNRSDDEIRDLISQIKIMEGDTSYATDNRLSELFELKHSVNDKQKKIDEQAKEIEERDSKIEALQRQLTEGSSGNEAQQVIDLSAELKSLRKEHKTVYLDSSVQLAKKDAMIAKLNDELDDANEENEEEAKVASSLQEEIENSKERLRAALQEIEESKSLYKKIEELEQRAKDAETVENGLQDAIDKWTDKTFEWRMKAEELEKEFGQLRGDGTGTGEGKRQSQMGLWGMFGEN